MTISNEITVNGVSYVRKDSVETSVKDTTGLVYCIVRSRDQGVICGYVKDPTSITGREVTVEKPRQVYSWNSKFVLVDLAEDGPVNASEMKMSCAATNPLRMLEACGIYICTPKAAEALEGIPAQVKK